MTTYTAAQQEAITCLDEPLQIIACAGSGKTQVISQRIASILSLPGVEPRNVIAFTFTEKAAAELKERLRSVLDEVGVGTQGIAEMYVGTMHGYALDLVQRLVPETFKFSVLTEITTRLFIDRNSRKSGLTECPTLSPGTPVLGGSCTRSCTCRRPASFERTPSTSNSSPPVFLSPIGTI